MKTNDGGTAFPVDLSPMTCDEPRIRELGLTKREWFAGMALAGMMAGVDMPNSEPIAKLAFDVADAMLRESEKGEPTP